MATITERENLLTSLEPRLSAFSPRPAEKLTVQKKATTTSDIDYRHVLRCDIPDMTKTPPSALTYRLWLEAGKHEMPTPEENEPDQSYNSCVWRNFRRVYHLPVKRNPTGVSESIALLYPMKIPPPSAMGCHNYVKFLENSPVIQNEKHKKITISHMKEHLAEMQRLKLNSELRNPPRSRSGQILPPTNYNRTIYRYRPSTSPNPATDNERPVGETRLDMFGQTVPVRKQTRSSLTRLKRQNTRVTRTPADLAIIVRAEKKLTLPRI